MPVLVCPCSWCATEEAEGARRAVKLMMPDDSSRYWVMHSSARMDTLRMFKVLWLSAKSVGKAEACDHRWGRGQFTIAPLPAPVRQKPR
jgi:hypothetical protein